jgi:hypothetical protein
LNSSVDSKSTDMITVPLALAVADQSSDWLSSAPLRQPCCLLACWWWLWILPQVVGHWSCCPLCILLGPHSDHCCEELLLSLLLCCHEVPGPERSKEVKGRLWWGYQGPGDINPGLVLTWHHNNSRLV